MVLQYKLLWIRIGLPNADIILLTKVPISDPIRSIVASVHEALHRHQSDRDWTLIQKKNAFRILTLTEKLIPLWNKFLRKSLFYEIHVIILLLQALLGYLHCKELGRYNFYVMSEGMLSTKYKILLRNILLNLRCYCLNPYTIK